MEGKRYKEATRSMKGKISKKEKRSKEGRRSKGKGKRRICKKGDLGETLMI